jgi:hypothetical protein
MALMLKLETMVRHASEHDVMVITEMGSLNVETSHVLYLRRRRGPGFGKKKRVPIESENDPRSYEYSYCKR